jgi:hypothetical protein
MTEMTSRQGVNEKGWSKNGERRRFVGAATEDDENVMEPEREST